MAVALAALAMAIFAAMLIVSLLGNGESASLQSRGTTTASDAATVPAPAPTDSGDQLQPGRSGCCNQGDLDLFVVAGSAFDRWTSDGGYWGWMNSHYERMIVWRTYWDTRLDDYSDVLVYHNAYSIKVNGDERATEHPDWILRTADGSPVYIPWGCDPKCPQYAANTADPGFREDWFQRIQRDIDAGYRAFHIDDVNYAWRLSNEFGDPSTPLDPQTGEELTLEAWQRAMTELLEEFRHRFPDVEIWHNAIWFADSPDFDNTLIDRQIAAADVVHLERGMNDRGLTLGSGQFGMETFMAYIDRVHAHGAHVALLDQQATSEHEQNYNIAGALLVNDGGDLVSTEAWEYIAPAHLYDGFLVDLGHGQGPRRVVGTTIQREFQGGLVILNQPDAPTVVIELDHAWLDPNGRLVTSVELAPRRAIVLRRPSDQER